MSKTKASPVLCLMAALSAWGCGKTEPILIGAAGDLRAGVGTTDSGFQNGILLAEEAINEQGGIGGTFVRVVYADDQGDPDYAPRVAEKLIASGVKALVGHTTSATTLAALPVVNRNKILLVGPEATSSELAGRDDFFVRVESAEKSMAEALAVYAADTLKLRVVGAVLDEKNRPFTRPYFEAFRKKMESLGAQAELLYPYHSLDPSEAGRQVEAFLARGGQAVLLITNGADTRHLGQLVRRVRADLPLLGSTWAVPPSGGAEMGPLPEGLVFPCTWDPDSQSKAYLEFKKRYEERFARPVDYHAVHAYEALVVLSEGLRKAGLDREKVRKAITRIADFEGLQGRIHIDAFGDCQREIHVLSIVDGTPRRAPQE